MFLYAVRARPAGLPAAGPRRQPRREGTAALADPPALIAGCTYGTQVMVARPALAALPRCGPLQDTDLTGQLEYSMQVPLQALLLSTRFRGTCCCPAAPSATTAGTSTRRRWPAGERGGSSQSKIQALHPNLQVLRSYRGLHKLKVWSGENIVSVGNLKVNWRRLRLSFCWTMLSAMARKTTCYSAATAPATTAAGRRRRGRSARRKQSNPKQVKTAFPGCVLRRVPGFPAGSSDDCEAGCRELAGCAGWVWVTDVSGNGGEAATCHLR